MARDVHEIGVELNFGIFKINSKWNPTPEEQKAAWELYVELATRISIFPLGKDQGSDREALSSLYELFQTTRKVLRAYGPDIAVSKDKDFSVAYLAIAFLNYGLRPFLAEWHPKLEEHESGRPAGTSKTKHEHAWAEHDNFRKALEGLNNVLIPYADYLADGAGVPRIVQQQQKQASGSPIK